MKRYQSAIGVRGDSLYCPLPLSIDTYWNCEPDCYHCYSRRLNRVWGMDLRPADSDAIARKLYNGLHSHRNPRSSLAWALYHKKTLRVGNRSDPYQPAELKHQITHQVLHTLIDLKWTFIIQTRFTDNMSNDEDLILKAHSRGCITLLPVISPGGEWDRTVLEKGITPRIDDRLKTIKHYVQRGIPLGVGGEPFIPGLHTEQQFKDILKRLKAIGVGSYNTYNLHFNDHVAKQLVSIGLDIERIWYYNQDEQWRLILRRLCEIADRLGIVLGCPDFVNVPHSYIAKSNTCCGISVTNPSRFNTDTWRRLLMKGKKPGWVLKRTWEGIGSRKMGRKILFGKPCEFYTMKDAGML